MIPSPALDKVRGVVVYRRVGFDIVGNVLHSLCGSSHTVSQERSGTGMTQMQPPHQVRSGHPPSGSASGHHTLGRERANLRDGILRKRRGDTTGGRWTYL